MRRARIVTVVAVAVCAAAVVIASRATGPLPGLVRHSRTVAVSAALLTCPGAGPGRRTATTTFAATWGGRAARGGGALGVRPLTAHRHRHPSRLTVRGRSLAFVDREGAGPSVVRALGSLAAGAVAAQWSVPRTPAGVGGMAVSRCVPPGTDWWFSGAATAAGASASLVLVNPSTSVAVVDLAFFGPAGAVATPGSRGIAVPPRSARTIDLARFAPASSALTVNVQAVQGQIGAALHLFVSRSSRARGTQWLPAGLAPSRRVLVDPAGPAASDRRLLITNPSSREALLQVRVIDAGGEFTPVGFANLRLAPGAVRQLRLAHADAGSATAVQLTSTEPVVAATLASRHARAGDFAVSTSGSQLDGAAVVPVIAGSVLSLQFVSTSGAGSALTVDTYDSSGRLIARSRAAVAGRRVTGWRLRHPAREAAYVVIDGADGSAGVHALAAYSSRTGLTALPVVSGSSTVSRPAVTPVLVAP